MPLKLPISVDLNGFKKQMDEAKSISARAVDMIAKDFAKQKLQLAFNSEAMRPHIRAATKMIGDEFQKVKPVVQNLVQDSVRESTAAAIKTTAIALPPITKGAFQAFNTVALPAIRGVAGAAKEELLPWFRNVLGVLGPIVLGVTAVSKTFDLMNYATELAKKRIEEFNNVAEQANKSGFSTEFFQRITKSSGDTKKKIDELTEAVTRFNQVSSPKLGGSELQQRIDELKKAGNLAGNSGLTSLESANSAEDRLRGIVTVINQMIDKGERLAAIDLAGRAFGPAVAENLRANSAYLDDMLRRADALSKTKIVSDEDLGRAVELKERMEAAQKVLAEKWKPIQDDLAKLGMNYHESWVDITADLASAVGYATQLYSALKQVPDWFANRLGNASIWKSLTDATGAMGLNSDPASVGLVSIESATQEAATSKLRAALQNHANVARGMRQATDVQSAVRGDTSKNPDVKKPAREAADAFDRASESLTKHTAKMDADARAVGLGSGALEELRAKAQLMAAAQQAGIPITDAMRAKIDALAASAREAGAALAKAKIDSSIEFQSRTALLSADDAAIAERLKPMFGNDVPAALASSQAAAMRFNGALRSVGSTIEGGLTSNILDASFGVKSLGDAFSSFGQIAERAIAEVLVKLLIVRPLMQGMNGLLGGMMGGMGGGGIGGLGLSLLGTGGLFADGGQVQGPGTGRSDSIVARVSNGEFVVNAESTRRFLPLLHAVNDNKIPKFADGGLIGLPANDNRFASNDNRTSFAPTINVKVEGGSKGPQADEALAKQIGAQVEASMRTMMAKELRTQMRPGGLLKR